MTDQKWTADIVRGARLIKPEAAELLSEMKAAADVAMLDIDLNEKVAIEQIKKQAAAKRAKINKTIIDMEQRPPIWLIRKFWHADRARLWLHFIGEATKIGADRQPGEPL